MALEWKSTFEIGVEEVDEQHKNLFDAINKLFDACKQGKGKDEINKVMDFLQDYVVEHFREEEALQVKYKYPDYENHKKLHDAFVNEYLEIRKVFNEQGASNTFVNLVNHKVTDWLIKHVTNCDKLIGAHIKSQLVAK